MQVRELDATGPTEHDERIANTDFEVAWIAGLSNDALGNNDEPCTYLHHKELEVMIRD